MIEQVWFLTFGERLPLDNPKRQVSAGRVKVLCPFHQERSPSCTVNVGLDAFKCFGCGASGGYLDVVVRSGNARDRREAREWLERRGMRL